MGDLHAHSTGWRRRSRNPFDLQFDRVPCSSRFPRSAEQHSWWVARPGGRCYGTWLGGDHTDVSPYASPAIATDLSGLPPAYVTTMEFDPLRDEGILYGLRLLQAGVSVELHSFAGTFHGSALLPARARQRRGSPMRRADSGAADATPAAANAAGAGGRSRRARRRWWSRWTPTVRFAAGVAQLGDRR